MMRYKRYRKRSSRVIKMKFQSFVDISTEADTMKIISVSAGGQSILQRLSPFFNAYKYYKLGSVSFKMVPASTLPVDPLGLSYSADDLDTVDPRDQLTPGMCRITNGEDILEDLTGLTGDQQRQLYNNMLLDPRWFKWMLQTGVKRVGTPRYWCIGQLHQDKFPGNIVNVPMVSSEGGLLGTAQFAQVHTQNSGVITQTPISAHSSAYGIFQTGHTGRLGWMPTDGLQPVLGSSGLSEKALFASPPEVELFKILMPPVRKTNYFYRCFITETVYFKEPIVIGVNNYRPIDVFHKGDFTQVLRPEPPTEYSANAGGCPDAYSGGNYGDH